MRLARLCLGNAEFLVHLKAYREIALAQTAAV